MKHISIILLAWLAFYQAGGDTYICKTASVSLYSKAPIEDIEAKTGSGASVYNSATGDIAFSVSIKSFKFDKSLMQEHFNENYMESDKYPNAVFKGKIQEHPDLSKDGTYSVNATGDLDVHGVKQARTIPGTLTVKGGTVSLSTEFMVKCADHKIKIPTLVFHNIAETIKIQVAATYSKYQSK
jgi:hypothetical protein